MTKQGEKDVGQGITILARVVPHALVFHGAPFWRVAQMDSGVLHVEDLRLALLVAFVDEVQIPVERAEQVRKTLRKRGRGGRRADRIDHIGAEALDNSGG